MIESSRLLSRSNIAHVVLKLERHRRGCDDARWALGDLAAGIVDGGDTLANAAASVGVERRTLERCYSVARAYPLADRSSLLSWKHHQVLASYPSDEADWPGGKPRSEWLRQAGEKGWSVGRMSFEIKRKPLRIHYREGEVLDRPFCGNLSSKRFSDDWGEVSCRMCLSRGRSEGLLDFAGRV